MVLCRVLFFLNRKSATGTTEPRRLSLLLYLNRLFFIQHFPLCSIYNLRYVYANRFVYDLLYRKYYGDKLIFFPWNHDFKSDLYAVFFFTWNSFEISCVPTMIYNSSCRFKNMRGPKEPTFTIFILSPILTRLLSLAFFYDIFCVCLSNKFDLTLIGPEIKGVKGTNF